MSRARPLQRLHGLFNLLALRERVLLMFIVWTLLLWWTFSLLGGYNTVTTRLEDARLALRTQEVLLAGKPEIDIRLAGALERLDPTKTFTASQLVARVDALARQPTGLSFDINPAQSEASGPFSVHTVRVEFNRARIAPLIEFARLLQAESPYIGLDSIRVTANRSDPQYLDARFEVSSFELQGDNL